MNTIMINKARKVVKGYTAFFLLTLLPLLASCADEFDRHFEAGRPDKTEKYAYLTDYKALKDYVADPNFHLGVGTDAEDYAKQGVTYVVTNANFTETVAGNAMKMASCVGDDGSMNFGTVEAYVKAATDAGLNVYGHTLAWHAQQPVKWLNSLLGDKVDPNYVPGEKKIIETEEDATCIQVVADDMAEFIVNTLEVVHIDDHVGGGGPLRQADLDLLRQIGTVPKSRHRIFRRDILETLGALLSKPTEFFELESPGDTASHDFRNERLTDKVRRAEL